MKDLNNNELCNVIGGITITGTIISAFTTAVNTVLDVGRSFGTAIRRVIGKNVCPVR